MFNYNVFANYGFFEAQIGVSVTRTYSLHQICKLKCWRSCDVTWTQPLKSKLSTSLLHHIQKLNQRLIFWRIKTKLGSSFLISDLLGSFFCSFLHKCWCFFLTLHVSSPEISLSTAQKQSLKGITAIFCHFSAKAMRKQSSRPRNNRRVTWNYLCFCTIGTALKDKSIYELKLELRTTGTSKCYTGIFAIFYIYIST